MKRPETLGTTPKLPRDAVSESGKILSSPAHTTQQEVPKPDACGKAALAPPSKGQDLPDKDNDDAAPKDGPQTNEVSSTGHLGEGKLRELLAAPIKPRRTEQLPQEKGKEVESQPSSYSPEKNTDEDDDIPSSQALDENTHADLDLR